MAKKTGKTFNWAKPLVKPTSDDSNNTLHRIKHKTPTRKALESFVDETAKHIETRRKLNGDKY